MPTIFSRRFLAKSNSRLFVCRCGLQKGHVKRYRKYVNIMTWRTLSSIQVANMDFTYWSVRSFRGWDKVGFTILKYMKICCKIQVIIYLFKDPGYFLFLKQYNMQVFTFIMLAILCWMLDRRAFQFNFTKIKNIKICKFYIYSFHKSK